MSFLEQANEIKGIEFIIYSNYRFLINKVIKRYKKQGEQGVKEENKLFVDLLQIMDETSRDILTVTHKDIKDNIAKIKKALKERGVEFRVRFEWNPERSITFNICEYLFYRKDNLEIIK